MSWREGLTTFLGLKPKVVYRVVELTTASRTLERWDEHTREAVATLSYHPGFLALVKRLEAQKGILSQKLNKEFHDDVKKDYLLKTGIFWLSYLQDEVGRAVPIVKDKQMPAYDEELESFKQIDAALERVGMDE